MGYPSFDDLSLLIKNNSIKDFPITTENIRLEKEIYGDSLACLKGKSVRTKSSKNRLTWTTLPDEFKRHKFVTLAIDIMYVGDLMFVVTLSNDIMFGTGEHIKNRELETILPCIKRFFAIYSLRGFKVKNFIADNEFDGLSTEIMSLGSSLTVVSANEHVGTIERRVRTIKERMC